MHGDRPPYRGDPLLITPQSLLLSHFSNGDPLLITPQPTEGVVGGGGSTPLVVSLPSFILLLCDKLFCCWLSKKFRLALGVDTNLQYDGGACHY